MNLMKAKDRATERAARQAELEACQDGTWPRNINDEFRWLRAPTKNRRIEREHAAKMCALSIVYLDSVDRRIAACDPDFAGWERSDKVNAPYCACGHPDRLGTHGPHTCITCE